MLSLAGNRSGTIGGVVLLVQTKETFVVVVEVTKAQIL